MRALSKATPEILTPFLGSVRNFGNKIKWLVEMGDALKDDKNIPLTLDELTALNGIGRKSANVILRESGKPAEGVIVDLHVVRLASRLHIATATGACAVFAAVLLPVHPDNEMPIAIADKQINDFICI